MPVVFASVCCQITLVYLNDKVVFLKLPADQVNQMERSETILPEQCYTQSKKWKRFVETIDYRFLFFLHFCLEILDNTANAVARLETTVTSTKLRFFLSLFYVLRQVVPKSDSLVALSIRNWERTNQIRRLTGERECFVVVSRKKNLISSLVLAVTKSKYQGTLKIYACNK